MSSMIIFESNETLGSEWACGKSECSKGTNRQNNGPGAGSMNTNVMRSSD